ncbi:MAG: hypothetical protein IT220_08385 [Flavobacteriaceae bacterium]|nr:hypothetical protein [Flavobacteriaceae bacterium]
MNLSSHTRFFALGLLLVLIAGRMRNTCKICQLALIGGFVVLIVLGIISYFKHQKKIKRIKDYEQK